MRNIGLFVEDFGHESFLNALVLRLAREYGIDVKVMPFSVRGGHGSVISELEQYLRNLRHGRADWLDLLVVATDANCKGFTQRKKEIDHAIGAMKDQVVCAIPDPHIERWLLIDSAAFKNVVGKGCQAPDQKCARDRYKRLLLDAMHDAGISPPLGGMEYAEDIVNAMNLQQAGRNDESLKKLIRELRSRFKAWSLP